MGMDLINSQGEWFRFSNHAWRELLGLAYRYGWQPEHDAEHYILNDGNFVSSLEARSMATAIEAALPDIPDFNALEHKTHTLTIPGLGEFSVFNSWEEAKKVTALELFSGTAKDTQLRAFITFARHGFKNFLNRMSTAQASIPK
jgi:hypothetical protein